MRWLITLAICLPLAAQQRSVVIASGQNLSFPYTSLTLADVRYEGELHAIGSATGSDRVINDDGIIKCYIAASTLNLGCYSSYDGAGSGIAQVNLSGYSEARFRWQRDTTALTYTLEVWDGAGANYTSSVKPVTIGYTGTTSQTVTMSAAIDYAFWRWSSAIVATGSTPPADCPTSAVNNADFCFQDNLTDRSSHAWTLTYSSGTPAYANTPVYSCSASFLDWLSPVTAKTTGSLALTSSSFCSRAATGVPSSITWSMTAGTGSASFSAASSSSTTFSNSTAGTKTIQLQVGDGTANTTTSHKVGIVAVSSDGCTVTQSNSNLEAVIGPVVIFADSTCSPWTYWDWLSLAYADQAPSNALGASDVAGVGSLISTSGAFTITSNPTTLTGPSGWTSGRTAGDLLVVAWTTADGVGTGRTVQAITSVDSATQVTLESYYYGPCLRGLLTCPSTVSVYNPKTPDFTCAGIYSPCFNYALWGYSQGAGNTNWNYYDLVLFLYRLGVRTGIDTYTQYAKDMADVWWRYALDSGAGNTPANRVSALGGAIARAVDGDGLTSRVTDLHSLIVAEAAQNNLYNTIADASSDKREMGYATGFVALAARFDSGNRASYCTNLQSMVDSWITVQDASGFYKEDLYAANPSYPNLTIGGSPWRQMVTNRALQYSYESLVDSAVCNDTTSRPASLLTSITNNLEWAYSQGRSSVNRGIYYNTGMGTQTLNSGNVQQAGTVTLTDSTHITGSGTNFTGAGICDGAHYFAPWASDPRSGTDIRRISSCADGTHLTLASAWTGTAFTGVNFNTTIVALTTCGAGSAPNCENDNSAGDGPPPNGMLSLVRLLPGNYGWLYRKTGDSTWKTRGDELFSATFGGPASGPGYTNACAGPACDGTVTDTAAALRDCASYAAPCTVGGNAFAYNATKNFPEAGGWADADRYLSDRLSLATPSTLGSSRKGNTAAKGPVVIR